MEHNASHTRISAAQALLDAAQAGDDAAYMTALEAINQNAPTPVFEEVGRMTREVHEALMAFAEDDRLAHLMRDDMPDARERLRYVITLTEQAANRTLSIIEEAMPVADRLIERSERLGQELTQVARAETNNPRLVTVVQTLNSYLDSVLNSGDLLKKHLTEVMMAQEFQDLSGQLLLRVITLLEQLETKMVGLLKLTSPPSATTGHSAEELRAGMGPAVPQASQTNVAKTQDDVDDLLASLGF
ncbi:protein phosphatase CheZ [Halothiobacillus sp. DCM-1]|uniref:protein phosphatase CheZ n=1 Tax=Halothiobacillus sp. DCM-1 TaxID=3112558 RepID=UPI00324C3DF5